MQLAEGHSLSIDTLSASNISGGTLSSGVTAMGYSKVNIKNAYIELGPTKNPDAQHELRRMALYASGESAVTVENGSIAGAIVSDEQSAITIGKNGGRYVSDVYATNGGAVSITLVNGSELTGQVDDYWNQDSVRPINIANLDGTAMIDISSAGKASINLDGGTWNAKGRSFVSDLSFDANGGKIDMTGSDNNALVVKNLKGSGTIEMKLGKAARSADGQIHSDMLYVENLAADSKNIVNVKLDGVQSLEDLEGLRFATTGRVDTDDNFKLKVSDQGFVNQELVASKEAFVSGDPNNALYNGSAENSLKPGNEVVEAMFAPNGAENWIVHVQDPVAPDPDQDPEQKPDAPRISDAGSTIIAMARSNYWTAVEMDRLNKRLGDARYANGTDGVWLRMRYESNGTSSGVGDFESDAITYQLGFDHAFKRETGRWVLGAAIDYKDADVDYKAVSGTGSSDRFGVKVYGTWLGDSGAYADVNAVWGVLSNSFDIVNGSGKNVTGSYDNHIMGVSVESGHRFDARNGLFVEPQVQFQYLHVSDGDYSTSQGTRMVQKSFNSVISRAGVRGGFTFGKTRENQIYAKADWIHEWSGDQKITAYDATTSRSGFDASIDNKGSWYDAGFGIQTKFSESSYGFFDVEHRFGNSLNNSWVLNAGIRYAF